VNEGGSSNRSSFTSTLTDWKNTPPTLNKLRSHHLIQFVYSLTLKHLSDYMSFIEVKLNRNIAVSYYWFQFHGLIHFSFINRTDHMSFIPTVEANIHFNVSESSIHGAYRKYLPISLTLLAKQDCTRIQFTDDTLQIVFTYYLWFEDKNYNFIPVDFTTNTFSEMTNYWEMLANYYHQHHHRTGMSDKSFYEMIKSICYPNAPADKLICYELFCVHSTRIDEETIKNQVFGLVNIMSKMVKNH
jgi:Hermansky-Pudlak syndrome 1 protein